MVADVRQFVPTTLPSESAPGQHPPRQTALIVADIVRSSAHLAAPGRISSLASELKQSLVSLQRSAADELSVPHLREIQQSIDTLQQASENRHRPQTAAGPAQADESRARIDEAQNAFDQVINGRISAARMSGNALKDFMETVFPDPNSRSEHTARILPLDLQRDLVAASKRPQRFAGVPRHLELAYIFVRGRQQNEAIPELEKACRELATTGDFDELAAALAIFSDGLANLNDADRTRVHNMVIEALDYMYPKIAAAKTSLDIQDKILRVLHRVALLHEKGTVKLSVEQRWKTAKAIEDISMSHIERSPGFRQMWMRLVDDEVRDYANPSQPANFVPYNVETTVIDLRHVQRSATVAPQGPGSTRPATISEIEDRSNYVKEIKHGPRAAASEDIAVAVIAVTGQATPVTQLARYEDIPREIASQLVPGYMDLGKLLLDKSRIAPIIETEWGQGGIEKLADALGRAENAIKRREEVAPKGEPRLEARPHRAELYKVRQQIYKLLPPKMQQLIGKAHFLSRLVGDDDFVNFEWANVGFTEDGECIGLDLGNALFQAFHGKQRDEANLEVANSRARIDDPYPPNQVRASGRMDDHRFSEKTGYSRTNVGGIPRAIPVATLLRESISAETRLAEFGGEYEDMRAVPQHEMSFLLGQLEGAFQLTFLTDKACRTIVTRKSPEPDDPSVPYQDHERIRPTAEELANKLIARRDALIKEFTPEELMLWKQRYPEQAKDSYNAIAIAIARMTGQYIPAYSTVETVDKGKPELTRRNSL